MFCPKCGAQIADNSVFCSICGSSVATNPQPQQIVQQQPNYVYVMPAQQVQPVAQVRPVVEPKIPLGPPIFESKERGLTIAAAAIYMLLGLISAIVVLVNCEALLYAMDFNYRRDDIETLSGVMYASAFIGLGLNICFGVFACLMKKWALIVIKVFSIMGIVSCGFSIITSLASMSVSSSVGSILLIISLLQLACYIVILCFLKVGLTAMSYSVQAARYKFAQKAAQSEVSTVPAYAATATSYDIPAQPSVLASWICSTCGTENAATDSFCSGCGKYK